MGASGNRAMFWRIIRRLLGANRGRLLVILVALGAGAAVTAALLNLQVDAKRRLSAEFRSFGANVIITPGDSGRTADSVKTMDQSVLGRVPKKNDAGAIAAMAFLYAIADVAPPEAPEQASASRNPVRVVLVGYSDDGNQLDKIVPSTVVEGRGCGLDLGACCEIGQKVASDLGLHAGAKLRLTLGNKQDSCHISQVNSFGGPEDGQIFAPLALVQELSSLPGRVSLLRASVPGSPRQIERLLASLGEQIPDGEVRPIRQFTQGEARIYNRISGLLTATVGIVLLLTGLCVMAAMTNVAMERKMDVGLMKAIGGATRRVLRLFLAEAALLGLAGGGIGAAAGIFLSIGLGKAVFGVAARPRLIVYPVAVALTVVVAILSAFPLRRLASIRPASVFRGEA